MNKKTIWITGGSTGIGKALAIKSADSGWNVVISARRENLLNEISSNNENIKIVEDISKDNNGSSFKWAKDLEERNKIWKARWDVYYSVKALSLIHI